MSKKEDGDTDMVELKQFDDDPVHRFNHLHNIYLHQEYQRPHGRAEVDLVAACFLSIAQP